MFGFRSSTEIDGAGQRLVGPGNVQGSLMEVRKDAVFTKVLENYNFLESIWSQNCRIFSDR